MKNYKVSVKASFIWHVCHIGPTASLSKGGTQMGNVESPCERHWIVCSKSNFQCCLAKLSKSTFPKEAQRSHEDLSSSGEQDREGLLFIWVLSDEDQCCFSP